MESAASASGSGAAETVYTLHTMVSAQPAERLPKPSFAKVRVSFAREPPHGVRTASCHFSLTSI